MKRITDPIESMKRKNLDVDTLNSCKWVMEANNLNSKLKKPAK